MAMISEHGNILNFVGRIHKSWVMKLRKIGQLRLAARTRKLGYVYRILIKISEAISNLIMDGILIGKLILKISVSGGGMGSIGFCRIWL
jgi:hypothetical protein